MAVYLCGALLGVLGRDVVAKLLAAWGGLGKHKPLVEATSNWLKCATLKLIHPADQLAIGGVMIRYQGCDQAMDAISTALWKALGKDFLVNKA